MSVLFSSSAPLTLNTSVNITGWTKGNKSATVTVTFKPQMCGEETVSLVDPMDKITGYFNQDTLSLNQTVIISSDDLFAKFNISQSNCFFNSTSTITPLPGFVQLSNDSGLTIQKSKIES